MLKDHFARLAQMDVAYGTWDYTICPASREEQIHFTSVVVLFPWWVKG